MARYVPGKPLWSHQRRGLDLLRGREAFALLMAMRTGKTPLTLADFGRLELSGDAQDLLIVAPAGVYETWNTAFEEHLSGDLRRRLRTFTWSASDRGKKRRAAELDEFMYEDGPRALLMNVEAFSGTDRARELAMTFLYSRRSYCVVDESTRIKGPDAERAKFVVEELGPRADWRRILSGLPTPRSPLDAYMQFKFLDEDILGFKSWYGMRARHAIMRPMAVNRLVFDGPDNAPRRYQREAMVAFRDVEDVHAKIAPYSYRVLLSDCYDLPPKMYSFRDVEWHPKQRRIYESLRDHAIAELDEQHHVTVQQVLTQMLRLHQVLCGHTRDDETGQVYPIEEYRTRELLDLLEEHDGKTVIWCAYDYNVRALSEAISRRFDEPVARFWGGNRRTREEEEKMFQTDPRCRHMVATAAAGSMGRQWSVADLTVYHSNTQKLEDREQSEERTQLFEKSRSSGYVDLRIPGTVDDRYIRTLRNRMDLAATVTGDAYREWII